MKLLDERPPALRSVPSQVAIDPDPAAPTSGRSRMAFDYLTKLFSIENRTRIEDYVKGELQAPIIIEFDPTTACNFSCPECISAGLLNKDYISPTRVEALIEEFAKAGVRGVIFIGGGEPLAHKSMPHPIRQCHELGMQVGLTTNGSLIPRHLDTLAECVAWTRVSMDAGTAETFNIFRPNKIQNSFKLICDGMSRLARVKKGLLGYSYLIIQAMRDSTPVSNAHEIYEAARISKEIGCDYFEFKPMVDERHFLVPFDSEMRRVVAEQAALCRELEDETFQVIAPASIAYLSEHDEPLQPKRYSTCPSMELRTLVTPSGIFPCPYMRGREDKKLGDVNTIGDFGAYWSSDVRKALTRKVDPSRDCNFYCIRHRTNATLDALTQLEGEGVQLLSKISSSSVDDVFL